MKNWLVCASVTDAARKIIEENGGTIETLSENAYEGEQRIKPRLLLVTINDALYNGRHTDYRYFSYVLSSNRSGICFWDDDPIALSIYAWDGKNPNDPDLRRGMEPDSKFPWEVEDGQWFAMQEIIDELRARKLARIPSSASQLWKSKGYPPMEYDALSRLFWQVLNDPEWEHKYNHIVAD